jgi:hypothetical protein
VTNEPPQLGLTNPSNIRVVPFSIIINCVRELRPVGRDGSYTLIENFKSKFVFVFRYRLGCSLSNYFFLMWLTNPSNIRVVPFSIIINCVRELRLVGRDGSYTLIEKLKFVFRLEWLIRSEVML